MRHYLYFSLILSAPTLTSPKSEQDELHAVLHCCQLVVPKGDEKAWQHTKSKGIAHEISTKVV